jgi:hypothetical protein
MFELRGGIDLRTEKYDGDPDYNRHAKALIKSVIKGLTAIIKENCYAADIIAGWRHGYAADAVARYIVIKMITNDHDGLRHFHNQYSAQAEVVLRQLLNLETKGWGAGYGYTPSVAELVRPAPVVQGEINARLAIIRKLINAENNSGFAIEPQRLFNEPIENAGSIKHQCEVPVVSTFTENVFAEVRKLVTPVFVEQFDG